MKRIWLVFIGSLAIFSVTSIVLAECTSMSTEDGGTKRECISANSVTMTYSGVIGAYDMYCADYFTGSYFDQLPVPSSPTITLTVNGIWSQIGCLPPPPCGMNATDYSADDTQFKANTKSGFCGSGNVTPTPLFPVVNSSTTWICQWEDHNSRECTAHRILAWACGINATNYSLAETQFKMNSNVGFCSLGNILITPSFPAPNSSISWVCKGVSGSNTNCTANHLGVNPILGTCGSLTSVLDSATVIPATPGLCSVGQPNSIDLYSLRWTWKCLGIDGWSSASCSALRTYPSAPDGPPRTKSGAMAVSIRALPVCGNAQGRNIDFQNNLLVDRLDTCLAGSLTGWILTQGSGAYTWTCQNASQSAMCSAHRNMLNPPFSWSCQSRVCK